MTTFMLTILIILGFVILPIVFVYTLNIAIRRLIKSKKLLSDKTAADRIRVLTTEELSALSPQLKINKITLKSNDVYQLTNVQLFNQISHDKHGNITSTRIYAGDVEMYFPYDLWIADRGINDIDYVIAKVGRTLVAIAVRVNGLTLKQASKAVWSTDSASVRTARNNLTANIDEFGKGVLLSKRTENENEYKVRQSRILYIISALCFFTSLVFIYLASISEDPSTYNVTLFLASVAFIAMLISIFVIKKNNSALLEVFKIKGILRTLAIDHIRNGRIERIRSFIGLNYLLVKGFRRDLLQGDGEIIEAEVTYHALKKAYRLASITSVASLNQKLLEQKAKPLSRLLIFIGIATVSSIALLQANSSRTISQTVVYAAKYLPGYNRPVLNNYQDFVSKPVKIGDFVQLTHNNNFDAEVTTDDNGAVAVNYNQLRLGAKQKLELPSENKVLLNVANNFKFEIPNGKKYVTTQKQGRTLALVTTYTLNQVYVYKITQLQQTFAPIMQQCEQNAGSSSACNTLFEKLSSINSGEISSELLNAQTHGKFDLRMFSVIVKFKKYCEQGAKNIIPEFKNLTTNLCKNLKTQLSEYKLDSKPLTAEKIKKLLTQDNLWMITSNVEAMQKYIRAWAMKTARSPLTSEISHLTEPRGGIILVKQDIVAHLLSKKNYHNYFDKLPDIDQPAKAINSIQTGKFNVSGIVMGISHYKGMTYVELVNPSTVQSQQSLAVLLGWFVSLLVSLVMIIIYFLPTKYPRTHQTNSYKNYSSYDDKYKGKKRRKSSLIE